MKSGKFVILAIDDDIDVLNALRIVLEDGGYVVVEAHSAEEGVRLFKQLGNRAPVYMLSSVGDSLASTVDFSEIGLQGVFQKPIDSATLLTTVAERLKS